jgi:hypothetical protein
MKQRLVLETPCEHGRCVPHLAPKNGVVSLTETSGRYCQGGSRKVFDEIPKAGRIHELLNTNCACHHQELALMWHTDPCSWVELRAILLGLESILYGEKVT